MPKLTPLRILHISDLHFSSSGAPPVAVPDAKVDAEFLVPFAGNRTEAEFLSYFRKLLRERFGAEDYWPKAVIITGDLVDRGGTDAGEYERAIGFVDMLAKELKISSDRVFIVPGNHDVDWSPGLTQAERFEKFFQATRSFATPYIDEHGALTPLRVDLRNIRDDIPVELTLLVSPTFSGILDPVAKKVQKQMKQLVARLEPGLSDQLLAALGSPEFLDIAVLGWHQREKLERTQEEDHEATIRIAVLHHHLLPDPQIEIARFESVLDAGKVLERLLDFQYDLVLNGHKHNRRLAQYRVRERSLDVFTSPSLFGRDGPGFTIIEVHGPTEPAYAALHCYDFRGDLLAEYELLRDGRIPPEVTLLAAKVDPDRQQRLLIPILSALGDQGFGERLPLQSIFEEAWGEIAEAAAALRDRRMLFRQPRLWRRWASLIEGLKDDDEIRVVSDNDLGFWSDRWRHTSDAREYASILREFQGPKSRILVLEDVLFNDSKRTAELEDAVGSMIEDGFRVLIAPESDVEHTVPVAKRDFGVLGDFVVYRFLGKERLSRSLALNFDEAGVRRAIRDWEDILPLRAWDSAPQHSDPLPIEEWVTLRTPRNAR